MIIIIIKYNNYLQLKKLWRFVLTRRVEVLPRGDHERFQGGTILNVITKLFHKLVAL